MAKKNKIILSAPASKSYLQRALAVSVLAQGTTILTNVSWCDDSLVAKKIVERLGAEIFEKNKTLTIKTNSVTFKHDTFSAGEAGLSIRMFSPVLALENKKIIITGRGSLLKRPVKIIEDALTSLGVEVSSANGFLPLTVKGPIKSGKINIDGSLSSQLLTGLLITLPLLDGNSEINVDNLKSRPYIDMTLEVMKSFGVEVENNNYKLFKINGRQKYKAVNYNIEGDWSGAAFWLVVGAVKGNVEVLNLNADSRQADKAILEALKKAGAKVEINKNSITVDKNLLNAFNFDATDCPDLFPPLACLASQCEGTSVIKGVSRLTYKESNRALVIKREFEKVGIKVVLDGDFMHITGGKINAGTIDSNNDHRIAMAGGILDMFSDEKVEVLNKSAVNKSYPDFFDVINSKVNPEKSNPYSTF